MSPHDNQNIFDIALNSSDINELKKLVQARDLNIRRCLAKNDHINSEIANALAFDPVLNVSFIASLHKNCTVQRIFKEDSILHRCIQCQKNEWELNCRDCNN